MYGIGYISRSLVDTLQAGNGLGKPTIKFEFEDNQALADFLTKTKENVDYAETVDADSNPLNVNNRRQSRKAAQQKALTDTPSNYLPPSDGTPSLPPSPTSPKSLPPSNVQPTPGLPSFNKVFENPDGIYFDERRIGDYGSINDNLRYINLYIDKNYSIGRNIFNYAEKILPNAVVIVCFVKDGKWKFYLERKKYQDAVRKYLPNFYVNGVSKYIVIDDIPSVERLVKAFEADGKNVVLIYRNIVDDINDVPSTHAALPPSPTTPEVEPQPEPTEPEVTAESVTDEEIETSNRVPVSVNFADIQQRMTNASHWSSFDPERSASSDTSVMMADYNTYGAQVPAGYENAFNSFFNKLSNNIISLKSRTANAAVTGGGGISARKAQRLNEANDRYWNAWRNFEDELERYVKKLQRRANRREFVSKSLTERSDERFEELKNIAADINAKFQYWKDAKKDNSLIPEYEIDLMKRLWGGHDQNDRKWFIWAALERRKYNIDLAKKNLQDKIQREKYNGNQLTVNRILDYLSDKDIFTPKHSIWSLRRDIAQTDRDNDDYSASSDFVQIASDYPRVFNGAVIKDDKQLDRVLIVFDGIPSEDVRKALKGRGFRWSPHYKAWLRKLTPNAVWEASDILKKYYTPTLGKPTIKLEFEDNGELMSLFDSDGISGMTVNDKPAAVFNCPESELDCQGFKPTYRRLSDYSHLIDAADGAKTLKGYGFEKSTLEELVNACRQYKQVERLAAHLKDPDKLQSAFNIWHWLHTNVKYNYDTPGQEEIRTPARTWADRERGVDCDCLAVFTACLLINMGYKPAFEIVAFNDSPTYSHIYVNLDGVAIDRVLPIFMARPQNITKTKIMEIPVYELSGVGVGRCNTLSGVYSSTLAKIQSGTATGNDLNDFRKTQVLVTLKGIDEDAYKLAALLMPHIATVGDDGKYYFDSAKFAEIATKADAGLSLLKQQGASKEVLQNWLAEVVSDIDIADTTATASDEDTIVVVINPKGCPCRVAGNFTATELQTLSPMAQTATAQDTAAAATPSPVYATTPYPTVQPEEEKSNTKWWILGGLAAAFGLVAISKKKNGRR